MKKAGINIKMWRYVYIVEADNRGVKSKYFGLKKVFYVGQTNNLVRRFKEHLHGINSTFLAINFPNSTKKLVFVDYVYGTEYDAMAMEIKIKKKSTVQKKKLISSEQNKLINYVPFKGVVLKKNCSDDENILLKF